MISKTISACDVNDLVGNKRDKNGHKRSNVTVIKWAKDKIVRSYIDNKVHRFNNLELIEDIENSTMEGRIPRKTAEIYLSAIRKDAGIIAEETGELPLFAAETISSNKATSERISRERAKELSDLEKDLEIYLNNENKNRIDREEFEKLFSDEMFTVSIPESVAQRLFANVDIKLNDNIVELAVLALIKQNVQTTTQTKSKEIPFAHEPSLRLPIKVLNRVIRGVTGKTRNYGGTMLWYYSTKLNIMDIPENRILDVKDTYNKIKAALQIGKISEDTILNIFAGILDGSINWRKY